MREIKFRGKLLNNKHGWSYGNLSIKKNAVMITPDETIVGVYGQVDKETVGQYTGLKDKNGVEIYEGDILESNYDYYLGGYCEKTTVGKVEITTYGIVVVDKAGEILTCLSDIEPSTDCEIIGNIYDNPNIDKRESQTFRYDEDKSLQRS